MSDKSQKVAKILLAVAGTTVGVLLIAKYHKTIIKKLTNTKEQLLYKYANIQRRPKFQIEIVNHHSDCESYINMLRSHCINFPALGFDCEWVTVNNERRKIALIQLCSPEGLCVLFRICKFEKIPVELRTILEDPDIIKAGVTPSNDAKFLLQDYSIHTNGTLDLRFLALLTQHKPGSLAKLSKSVLDMELDKDWRVSCSDWEIETMSPIQIEYAANDAYVGIEILRQLYTTIKPGEDNPDQIKAFCDKYTDLHFTNKAAQLNFNARVGTSETVDKKILKSPKTGRNPRRSYSSRSSPLYYNCYLQAPDGELLCTLDRKRAEWYITKGIGTLISEDPNYTVRLNFEPAGRAVGEVGEFYRTVRENICVVCGETKDLIRKNVVPHEYRKFFPYVMKDKSSHDILLLCIGCHQQSNIFDLKMRKALQEKCDAPLDGAVPKDDIDAERKLKSEQRWARALIEGAYPNEDMNDDFLVNLLSKTSIVSSIHSPSHGEMVVQRYRETEGLVALEREWRQHFLDSMSPMYLPNLWDVNHNTSRLEIRASEGRVEAEDLKIAGVNAVIVPKVSPVVTLSPPKMKNIKDEDDVDTSSDNDFRPAAAGSSILDRTLTEDFESSSDYDFRSAAGSRNSSILNRTVTDDDHYFSDATSMRSYYETIKSDGSTIDDFHSFSSSLTERPDFDSDGSRTSLCSQELTDDSETEVEDNDPSLKMEL